jgi:hypothetical protein
MPFITTEEAKWRLENSPMDAMLNKYRNSSPIVNSVLSPNNQVVDGENNKVEGDPTPG